MGASTGLRWRPRTLGQTQISVPEVVRRLLIPLDDEYRYGDYGEEWYLPLSVPFRPAYSGGCQTDLNAADIGTFSRTYAHNININQR